VTRRTLLVAPLLARAHGTHASRTLIDAVAGELQITVNIPAAELEEYLRFQTKRQLELDRDQDAPRIVSGQLRQWLQIQDARQRPLALRWVGLQAKAQTIECFLETKAPPLEGLRLKQTALIGWQPNWINQVVVRRDQPKAMWSYQFHQGKTEFATVHFAAQP
jgi:hypothetical protein